MASRRAAFFLPMVVALAGCSFTTMSPGHRLADGELVVQGSLDEPGILYLPRLSGAVTYGVGDRGDVGAHLGTTILTVNAGGTLRYYAAPELALSLQGDIFTTTISDYFFSNGRVGALTITPRVGRILRESSDHFYGGFQGMTIVPFNVQDSSGPELTNSPAFGAGGYVGLSYDTRSDFDFQIELSGSPLGIAAQDAQEGYQFTPLPLIQLGFAVQFRREREPVPPPTPEPAAPSGQDRIL